MIKRGKSIIRKQVLKFCCYIFVLSPKLLNLVNCECLDNSSATVVRFRLKILYNRNYFIKQYVILLDLE